MSYLLCWSCACLKWLEKWTLFPGLYSVQSPWVDKPNIYCVIGASLWCPPPPLLSSCSCKRLCYTQKGTKAVTGAVPFQKCTTLPLYYRTTQLTKDWLNKNWYKNDSCLVPRCEEKQSVAEEGPGNFGPCAEKLLRETLKIMLLFFWGELDTGVQIWSWTNPAQIIPPLNVLMGLRALNLSK